MKKLIMMVTLCLFLCGCAKSTNIARQVCTKSINIVKQVAGVSTEGIEKTRADASVKVFDYSYKVCYEKVEALLKRMPNVSIYAKNKEMIAVYVIDPDTTSVGVFFKEIDPGHTQVEISSESTPTKEWMAGNIFSETVLKEEEPRIKI